MEIFPVRSSQSWLFGQKDKPSAARSADGTFGSLTQIRPTFEVRQDAVEKPDFNSISAAELRRLARESFDQGSIDGETFATLSEPLPMQTIDTMGNVVDLSGVSDATNFNFRDYYRDRLQIATSIGDAYDVDRLRSVVNFMG
ncbi:hypothetical protein [Oryzifoliimicrobium ureilyticus]|uniref:hypothetical protein n=1 Tax=Oryzifoliimicrobium ureilyticus TaxID=3113724 RepID=UPI00307661D6